MLNLYWPNRGSIVAMLEKKRTHSVYDATRCHRRYICVHARSGVVSQHCYLSNIFNEISRSKLYYSSEKYITSSAADA